MAPSSTMNLMLSILGAVAAKVAAANLESPLPGYTSVPMTWYGINEISGSNVTINGTIQEIQDQILLANQSIKWVVPTTNTKRYIVPRDKTSINCGVGGNGPAENTYLQDGIDHLNSVTDHPCIMEAGPGVCTRVSCSDDTAIWVCNDNSYEIQHSCPDLATYAVDIRAKCHSYTVEMTIRGEEYDSGNFHVVVGGDSC